jgi:hypothetical protein
MAKVVETLALAENRSQTEIYGALITEAPNTTIQAVVTHIATPNADFLSGEIALLSIIVNKLDPIHTELSDRDYILALKAYQQRLPIYCTGDLIKENGTFILKNPHQLKLG